MWGRGTHWGALSGLGVALLAVSCGGGERAASGMTGSAQEVQPVGPPEATPTDAPTSADCTDPVPVYRDGEPDGMLCAAGARARALTVIDLRESWTPRLFTEDATAGRAGENSYGDVYLALAAERLDDLPEDVPRERHLEPFGIFPTFEVLRARLADDARQACHAAIDDAPLRALSEPVRAWGEDAAKQRALSRQHRRIEAHLEQARAKQGVESLAALEGASPKLDKMLARHRDLQPRVAGIAAAQRHLRCDGLLGDGAELGVFRGPSARALASYQRRHLVLAEGTLDAPTRETMAQDSREADFRAVLRALRERVIAAAGLIEDGSASQHERVLGRYLEPAPFRDTGGHAAPPSGAPDRIARATEAAARALGWTSPERFVRFMRAPDRPSRIAVALPPRPAYHDHPMTLRAEVDRAIRGRERPTLTLYAEHEGREVALVRWLTTIGGWKDEQLDDGEVERRYKRSPTGRVHWREVWAAPAWLPPPTTPDDELVMRDWRGWHAREPLLGPGHRSAYGLAMLVHHRPIGEPTDEAQEGSEARRVLDQGIRTHGSVAYRSIRRGTSHGCHRLYNHLAVRLGSFLLTHRAHARRGPQNVQYSRRIERDGTEVQLRATTRGTLFELREPIPVDVR